MTTMMTWTTSTPKRSHPSMVCFRMGRPRPSGSTEWTALPSDSSGSAHSDGIRWTVRNRSSWPHHPSRLIGLRSGRCDKDLGPLIGTSPHSIAVESVRILSRCPIYRTISQQPPASRAHEEPRRRIWGRSMDDIGQEYHLPQLGEKVCIDKAVGFAAIRRAAPNCVENNCIASASGMRPQALQGVNE